MNELLELNEAPSTGVPQWIVTYGDLMALLLTFFIMLVSMSEIKQNDKFQGVADSLHRQFGYSASPLRLLPGELRPRSASLAAVALAGRDERRTQLAGRSAEPIDAAAQPQIRVVRTGNRTTIGGVVPFDKADARLSPAAQGELRRIATLLAGKPQKIEVRGHSSQNSAAGQNAADNWDLAYQRAHATMRYLIDELAIPAQRIRLSVAGPYEPVQLSLDARKMRDNPRVEVFLLEELIGEALTVPNQPTNLPTTNP